MSAYENGNFNNKDLLFVMFNNIAHLLINILDHLHLNRISDDSRKLYVILA